MTTADVSTSSAGQPPAEPSQAAASPPLEPRRRRARQAVAAAILLAVTAIVAVPFWPGRMNADTLNEISEVDSGSFSDHHAPVLQALWHVVYHHGVGPGWILTGQTLAFVVGVFLVMRLAFSVVGSAVATAIVCLVPQVYGFLGLVGRDTWFIAALMLSFGCIARVPGSHGTRRAGWVAGALLAGWIALASRQNAAAASVVAFALLAGLLVGPSASGWSRRRLGAIAAAGLAITIGLFATQVVFKKAIDVRSDNPAAPLYLYDLAAMSSYDRRNYLPPSATSEPTLASVDARFNTDGILAFLEGPDAPIKYPIGAAANKGLSSAWRKRVGADPLGYVRARAALFVRQVSLTRPAEQTYHPFIDENPWGYATSFAGPNELANDYLETFADDRYQGNVLFRVWIYLLIAAGLAVVLLRRRRFAAVMIGSLALTALTYQSGIIAGAMGVTYRFEYPSVVLTIVAAAAAVGLSRGALRRVGGPGSRPTLRFPSTGRQRP